MNSTLSKMTTSIRVDQTIDSTRSTSPVLPAELWLQILEKTGSHEALHLWGTVHLISPQFRNYVERIFISTFLPQVIISLALPQRDPTTGTLKWPGDPIPQAHIVFSFEKVTTNQRNIVLRSPESLGSPGEMKSVDELRFITSLSEERLREAPPCVRIGNPLNGLKVAVQREFGWDDDRKIWTWEMSWRKLVTHLYQAKMLKRESSSTRKHNTRSGRP